MALLRNRVVDGAMGILGIQRVGYQRVIENTIIAATAAAAVVFIFRRRTYTNQKKKCASVSRISSNVDFRVNTTEKGYNIEQRRK